MSAIVPTDPRRLVADEWTSARRARAALIAGALIVMVLIATLAVFFSPFFGDFFREVERSSRSRPPGIVGSTGSLTAGSLVLSLVQIGSIVVAVLFIVWAHNAARAARSLGIPARLAPAWAVLGWIVPVVNLWLPYQVVVDCLPLGHPARRIVARWWGLCLALGLSVVAVIVGCSNSLPAVLATVVLAVTMAVLAAQRGRQVILAIADEHRHLLEEQGPGGQPGRTDPTGPPADDGGVGFTWG